jgi:hypothetical protein
VNREPLCRVPQDIDPDSSTKSAPVGGESIKVTKPRLPTQRRLHKKLGSPRAQVAHKTPLVLVVLHLHLPELLRVPILQLPHLVWNHLSPPGHP